MESGENVSVHTADHSNRFYVVKATVHPIECSTSSAAVADVNDVTRESVT